MSDSKDTIPGPIDAESAADALRPRLLVVDDDAQVARAIGRGLRDIAQSVTVLNDPLEALALLSSESFDVVIADVAMPGMQGTELLRAVRARDLDLPVILLTGQPTIASAVTAVELGAFRYLTKPYDTANLRAVVHAAARTRFLTRAMTPASGRARAELEASLRRTMATLHMAYQPIVSAETHLIIGQEALMRSSEPALPNPMAVLDAAEKLGALHLLGRRTRNLVAAELDRSRPTCLTFVNLHPADLADWDLYEPGAPLSKHAAHVVFELTERSSLEGVGDLDRRLEKLRSLGFRVAVDDLGAGYAGLSCFAHIQPEIVKIDMSLVQSIDTDVVKQRVVLSLVTLATGLGMEVVAEGVETIAERDMAVSLGVTYLQGYLLARPGPAFPSIVWH